MATASSPLHHASSQYYNSQLLLDDRSNANLLFLGHVRQIRAEAQNLIRYSRELKDKLTDPNLNIADVAKEWQTIQLPAYQQHLANVKDLFAVIKKLMEDNPILLDRNGDAITQMGDVWERVDPQWPRFAENEAPDENVTLARIVTVDALLCEVIKTAEILTLPERINERLRELRVGQTINFNTEFSEELPEPAARVLALHYLHDHPLMVLGVVDVESGLIYRASSNIWQRRLSPVYIAIPAVVGGLAVYLSYTFLPFLNGTVPHNYNDVLPFVTAYISIIAGGFAHTAVDTVKQYRTSSGQTFTALGDLLMWIHVKKAPLMGGTVLLWIGFVGLILLQGPDWGVAFFIGYSIDSFVDLFLQRFATVSTSRTDTLKTQITQPARTP
jgi:hypothetical protein